MSNVDNSLLLMPSLNMNMNMNRQMSGLFVYNIRVRVRNRNGILQPLGTWIGLGLVLDSGLFLLFGPGSPKLQIGAARS